MKNDPKEGLAILHLEDNGGDRMLVRELLSQEGIDCQIQAVQSKEEFETALRSRDIRLIVSDYTLPSTDGLTALRIARTIQPETPFIFFSGTIGEELAIESLRQGATDYVLKQRPDRLVTAVRRALREADERRQLAQAEAALRQREELFRQITENVDDLIAVLDRQGRRVFNSPSYQRILGDPRSIEGKDSFAEIHPEDRSNVQRVFQETVATGVGRRVEYRFLLKDGSVRFIESQGSVIRDASDEVSHVVVVSRDVTERRRTEEQMREQAAMLEKAHDAICVTDTELRITYWNRGAAVLYGWEPREAVGAFVHELLFEADSTEPATALKTLIARSEWQGEYTQTFRDGRRMIVEGRWTMLRDEEGRPKSILLINRDVTERKQAQVKVQEQAALLEKAQDAIFVRDLEQRITYWNRGAERIYGWEATEVMGKRADQLLYKEASPAREEIWREFLERGEWAGELEQITKAGMSVIIQSRRTLLLDPEGHPRAILNINTDVTEQRQLESKFLRTQRLESIGALAGGIAHDLNNVLAPVLMGVEFLRDTVTGEGNQRVLETISSSARRGADMVRQILSFARGVEGRRGVLQMRHLLGEMTALIQDTFPRSIQIETGNAANLHPVTGDATQIQQVLLNLCVNARDAMPEGGTLRLETSNVQIENRTTPMQPEPVTGPFVRLLVSDTGTGIPSHVMDRIFEPFFTTKEAGRGTGLGLSTVLDIVRTHGGFVEVTSQEGRGTTFEVFLPAAPGPEQQAAEQAAPELPAGRAELVLVIDDETAVLEMTRTVLETFGYRVLTASDGPQALGLYRTHQNEVAVVLTDIMMSVMDGPATLRALREIRPGLKAIGLSGMDAEVQSAIQAGTSFAAFLTKPYSTRNLLETLRRTLDETPGS